MSFEKDLLKGSNQMNFIDDVKHFMNDPEMTRYQKVKSICSLSDVYQEEHKEDF
ncbi:hypothetical protein IV37_GL000047 [Fructilactobacillus fructivorans]|uniref:hypothetical protein n=1 Tax=Fructilactobacillus fructivorans TaxID=1614 RepID=UPI000712545D|nr:hypothetical protein [Fructilactobacillus fructivorans]KRN13334.1 hypothetical protein IV37_GL000047 [Fructilactobacillus fructivorans]